MSLINCPKCGKPISDTLKNCIHCKYDLRQHKIKEFEKTLKPYKELTESEKKSYQSEFCKQNDNYKRYFDNRYLDKPIKYVAAIIFLAISIILLIIKQTTKIENDILLIVLVIVNIVTICYLIFFTIKTIRLYRNKINWVIVMKKYKNWLCKNKKVLFEVSFKEHEHYYRRYFCKVNAEEKTI